MAYTALILALTMIVAASPRPAGGEESNLTNAAPAGTPETRYCMYIEAITGSRIETVKCWTREEWAQQGVDVDKEWAKEGVRTIG
jgi:hypothetical protein